MTKRIVSVVSSLMLFLTTAVAQAATLTYSANGQALSYSFNAHSGMTVQQAMQSVGPDYVTAWSHKYQGNSLLMVLGTANFPTTPGWTYGTLSTPYWLLCINGTPANLGMTQQTIPSNTTTVKWIWTSQFVCN